MPEEILSGDAVGVSATETQASVPDTNSQPEPNPWEAILNGTSGNGSPVPEEAPVLEEEEIPDAADEQIPADEEIPDPDKPVEEKPTKTRSQNFKDLQTENATLTESLTARDTEFSSLNERIAALDLALEAYGGTEQVGTLVENQNKFIDPAKFKEAVDYLSGLPQAPAVVGEILNRSFDLGDVKLTPAQSAKALANRVEVVNSALAKDFGLTEKLSPEEMEETFKWLAVRANKSKSELLGDIRDEIELLAPNEGDKADKATQKRIDDLEKQLQEQKESANPDAKKEEPPLDREKITAILNTYETEVIDEIAAVVLKDYGTTLEKLTPYKAKAFKALVRQELGAGETFIQLADYLISDRTHSNAKFLDGQYRNSVKTLMRTAAKEFLGKPLPTPPVPTPPGLTPKGKGSIQAPAPTGKPNAWAEILNKR